MASLDLRPLAVTRSEEQKTAATSGGAARPRERDDTAAGRLVAWRVRGSHSRQRSACSGERKGSAEIRNYITTLEAAIDVSALEAAIISSP